MTFLALLSLCNNSLYFFNLFNFFFKGALPGVGRFLPMESSLKMMKNAFLSTQKLFSLFRYITFCANLFGHARIRLIKKTKVNLRIYDVTNRQINICNTHIRQYFKKSRPLDNEACLIIECNMRYTFLEKSYTKCGGETSLGPFSRKSISRSTVWSFTLFFSLLV